MTTWQNTPGGGFYPQGQGYPYPPPPQNPGYPPNQGYPPPYAGGDPPGPGFIPPPGAPPYGQVPPPIGVGPVPIHPGGMYGSNYAEDPGQDEVKGFDFSEKTIRHGFIRKVYTILMCQLLITVSMIAWFLYHEGTKRWVQRHTEVFWVAFVTMFVVMICMACCSSVRRKSPMNYIFLFIFTLSMGFLLALSASTYDVDAVLMGVGITTVICLGLTIFAFQTKYDFTGLGSVLFVALLILVIFGFIAIFLPHSKTLTLVYASIGAFLFSVYLIYDTQLMLGGKHKYSVSPEEYIFAALNLYLDIVQIFLYIMTIIGASRE